MSADVPNHAGEWSNLEPKLSQPTLDTLGAMGFNQMTPVQAGAIPLFMKNKDVVVEVSCPTLFVPAIYYSIPLMLCTGRYRFGKDACVCHTHHREAHAQGAPSSKI